MEKLLIKQVSATDTTQEAAVICQQLLEQSGFFKNSKRLLLLSGGSCLDVAKFLLENLATEKLLSGTMISLGDERWVEVNSADSNQHQLEARGLITLIQDNGGEFIPFLGQETKPKEATSRLNHRLHQLIEEQTSIFLLAGMGEDGHTLGILPDPYAQRFSGLFSSTDLVVYYHLADQQVNPFRKRLTLSLSALPFIAQVVIFAVGDKKQSALEHLQKKDQNLNQLPALGLYLSPGELVVITDQNL
ncbi:MAG: hypothetical protein COY81_02555 [Candidatus Pacebacteria bacterium CG_4_10_14_0_8_um_filter_43_12]|nr:MAG: hypothetical protein COY81_02555 [Candidatus Pacebacteria bacterium CG_4_10_14_0_8_um_filter_43_12]